MKKDFEGMKKSFCCLLMLGIMCVLNIVCPNVVIWMCTDVLSIVLVIVTAILADRFV